jgi:hypothetical protein
LQRADYVDIPVVDYHSRLVILDDIKTTIGKVYESAKISLNDKAMADIGSVSGRETTLELNDKARADVKAIENHSWVFMHEGSNLRAKHVDRANVIMMSQNLENSERYKRKRKTSSPSAWIRNLSRGSTLYLTDQAKATVISAFDDFKLEMAKNAEAILHFLPNKNYDDKMKPNGIIELEDDAKLQTTGMIEELSQRIPIMYMSEAAQVINEKGKDISKDFNPFREGQQEEARYEFMIAVEKNKKLKQNQS